MQMNGYEIDIIVQGYPGRSVFTAGSAGARSSCCAAVIASP